MTEEININSAGARRWYSTPTGLGTAAALLAIVVLFVWLVIL